MELLLENYEAFLTQHREQVESDPVSIVTNNVLFKNYIAALSEAIEDEDAKRSFKKVAEREREMLLSEATLLSDNGGKAWAVMYFPLLADVYATPTISKILTTFTTNNPQVTIPKRLVKGEIIALDGTKKYVDLPSTSAVRPSKFKVTVSEGKSNLFDLLSLTDVKASVNSRYFAIFEVNVTESDGSTSTPHTIPVVIRADFSGNINGEYQVKDSDGNVYVGAISGKINYKTGDIIISETEISYSGSKTITFNNVKVEGRINVYGDDKGKVRVFVEAEDQYKVRVDQADSFFIELTTEEVQDLKDIYNIDILANAMQVVKLQFILNKDADVADLLKLSEPDMVKNGTKATVDFNNLPSTFSPSYYGDIFSAVVPRIIAVKNRIRKLAHVEPQYLLCGAETATVIESLQQYGLTKVGNGFGMGPKVQAVEFSKFNVVVSDAVEEGKVYVVYKAPVKQQAALVDIIYKPLYVEKSVDNGISKQFIKSRTMVEVVDTKKLGVVELQNIPV